MNVGPRSITMTCAAALTAACASAPSQRAYIAPTELTVLATAEEMTISPGQIIYVENRSSVPVTVYSFILRDCANIKLSCAGPRPLDLHVQPGRRVTRARVEPADAQRAFNFRYSFGWRADSSTTAALGVIAAAGDSTARRQLDAITRETVRRRGAVGAMDLNLTAEDIAGFADRAASLRAIPGTLLISVGH